MIGRFTRCMHATDILLIIWAVLLTVINLVFHARIEVWRLLVFANVASVVAILSIACLRQLAPSRFVTILHEWYVVPAVLMTFKQLYYMIKPIHRGSDYDDWLIAVDRWLFGVDPTVWLSQYAHPLLTEVLQIAYAMFYLMFIILGYEFARRDDQRLLYFYLFTCVYGFLLSYLGYFTLPAVGPRFTLHDFSALDQELPGLWLTPYLRWFVNAGESIPMGVPNEVAIAGTQRDVFPSGHTMMTLVLIWFGWKYRARVTWFLAGTGALLIVATVYQRYHYVVDLIAGAVFMVFCVWSAPRVYRAIVAGLDTLENRLPAS